MYTLIVHIHDDDCLVIDYRHQDDENVASRGSIAMKSAILKLNPTNKLHFEVHSTPSQGHSTSGQQKWYIKGSHLVEVNRWTQAIARNIELCKRDTNSTQSHSGSDADSRSFKSIGASLRIGKHSFSSSRKLNDGGGDSVSSLNEAADDKDMRDVPIGQVAVESTGDDDEDLAEDDYSDSRSERGPPHESSFALHGTSTAAQVDLTAQLLSSLVLPANASRQLRDLCTAIIDSAGAAQSMIGEYVRMVQERDEWWQERVERERQRGALWEESLQVVVQEGEVLENELKNRLRRRSRMGTEGTIGPETGQSTLRSRSNFLPGSLVTTSLAEQPPPVPAKTGLPFTSSSNIPSSITEETTSPSFPIVPKSPPPMIGDSESGADTDEEDEFFDAIDSGSIPLTVPDALIHAPSIAMPINIEIDQYEGYKHLRERLPIDSDNRPPTSLWSVLKHSIGKDLTKISFPVFFNEPTSMLQRMVSLHRRRTNHFC